MHILSTHLSVLYNSATLFSSATAFRIPRTDSAGQVTAWDTITYAQFLTDVEEYASYWRRSLRSRCIPERSIVGLWLAGFTYQDLLHIYGLSRAGYIPQLFSIRLPNPDVVSELLLKANAKALIVDTAFASITSSSPVPTFSTADVQSAAQTSEPLPPLCPPTEDDITFVFHTSGSTSGSPKLIPCTGKWLNAMIRKANIATRPRSDRQDVAVWMGSMCHIAQSFMLMGSLQHGSCTIQPTKIGFSSDELLDMIHRCQLNRLNQFSTFLSIHLRNSRSNPKLLSFLQALDDIAFSGLPMAREDEEWAYLNRLNLTNLFGSTELGAMMLSIGGRGRDAPLLRPIAGTVYAFEPIDPSTPTEGNHQSGAQLLELIIRSESEDCPHPSLRQSDGHFHTGDLFQEVIPGSYAFRGRNDDWIKSENSLRCDTKAIEDNVRQVCGHLLEDCIVVGTGRPSPALFVEPVAGVDHVQLKREIIRKTRPFHSRRYLHERITSPDLIIVVPPKSLPRTATKGNIRRQAVETTYKTQLDGLYSAAR